MTQLQNRGIIIEEITEEKSILYSGKIARLRSGRP
jgi:hypothetical protein